MKNMVPCAKSNLPMVRDFETESLISHPPSADQDDDFGHDRIEKIPHRGTIEDDLPLFNQSSKHAGIPASMAQKRARSIRRLFVLSGFLFIVGTFVFAVGPRAGVCNNKLYKYASERWHHETEEQQQVDTAAETLVARSNNGSFDRMDHMENLSPYFSSPGFGIDDQQYGGTPNASSGDSCQLVQGHVLHRHGARYPTSTNGLETFLNRNSNLNFTGPLDFLNDYQYQLGTNVLVPLGKKELFDSGSKAASLYQPLVSADMQQGKKLFARVTNMERVLDSGISWLDGFLGDSWQSSTDLQIQIEDYNFNTTLNPSYACDNYMNLISKEAGRSSDYILSYLSDARSRLDSDFGGGGYLTHELLFSMQKFCLFETVAFGSSHFCDLFTDDEWLGFEYVYDLINMYSFGPRSKQGAPFGLGWVNELIRRLEKKPYNPAYQTSENSTLDSDPETFPIDRRFYVDFTHDSTLVPVISALQLSEFNEDLPPSNPDPNRHFITSRIVPFAARLEFQVWNCDDTQYIRSVLNDAILPLHQFQQCPNRPDGLCQLDRFLDAQSNRNDQGWWQECTD